MSSALHKRLQRLEELLAARVAPPIWRWSFGDTAEHVVADVPERDRHRVQIWRWLTQEEARARGMELPPDPPAPQPYVPPQLPAPPERKLTASAACAAARQMSRMIPTRVCVQYHPSPGSLRTSFTGRLSIRRGRALCDGKPYRPKCPV